MIRTITGCCAGIRITALTVRLKLLRSRSYQIRGLQRAIVTNLEGRSFTVIITCSGEAPLSYLNDH